MKRSLLLLLCLLAALTLCALPAAADEQVITVTGTMTRTDISAADGLRITGDGTLTVTGSFTVDGGLTIEGCTVNVNNCLLDVRSGNMTVTDAKVVAGNTEDSVRVVYVESGTLTIQNSTFTAESGEDSHDAIYAKGGITITGSTVTAHGNGWNGSAGLETAGNLSITGSTVDAVGNNPAISAGGNMTLKSSRITSTSANSGISTSGTLTITGGTITATGATSKADVGLSGDGIFASGLVSIGGGATVTAKSTYGDGIYSNDGIQIAGDTKKVDATGKKNGLIIFHTGDITVGDGLHVALPSGGTLYTDSSARRKYFVDADGIAATRVVILPVGEEVGPDATPTPVPVFLALGTTEGGKYTAVSDKHTYIAEPADSSMNITVESGDRLTLTAVPDKGYVFKGWYEGYCGLSTFIEGPTDILLCADEVYTFTPTQYAEICAVFEKDTSAAPTPTATAPAATPTAPAATPAASPSAAPSGAPAASATPEPTDTPAPGDPAAPTEAPTDGTPTGTPTEGAPTEAPSEQPSEEPSAAPTGAPTAAPTTATVGGLKYSLKGSAATVTGPKSKSIKTAKIPATIKLEGKTYKVTAVKAGAFKALKKLAKVSVGKNVKTIGKAAFSGCAKLKSVTGMAGVTKIDASAFQGCKVLPKITLPAKVKNIGAKAFYKCAKLKSITIKTTKLTTKTVGKNAFKGVYKKAVVKVPAKKLKAYKTLLVKKGLPKTAKVKK